MNFCGVSRWMHTTFNHIKLKYCLDCLFWQQYYFIQQQYLPSTITKYNHAEALFSKWWSRSFFISISGIWCSEVSRLCLQHLSSHFSRKKWSTWLWRRKIFWPPFSKTTVSHSSIMFFNILHCKQAIRVAQVMDESLDNNNMDLVTRCIDLSKNRLCTMPKQENATTPECLPSFFSRFSASWVYSKILTLGVSVYERDRR